MEGKTFVLETLGCRTNQYETAAFRTQLEELGLKEAKDSKEADLCVVNTCTVTKGADKDSRYQVRRLLKKHQKAKVMVTGCFAEQNPAELEELSERVMVVPNSDKEFLIARAFPDLERYPEFRIKNFEAHTRAFVKVQDGCNSFCSYCIIPYVRGRSRSRKIEDILKEIQGLVKEGYKEVVLTGINIGDFDGGVTKGDTPRTLAELLRAVDALKGIERVRISSIDPDEVDDALLKAIMECPKASPSMHLVLQSGSNAILKRMNRKYTKQIFYDSVKRLQDACPDFTFTTDIIVGFPGEDEEDFEETLEVVRQIKFAKVHMFPYSPRPRTKAFQFQDTIDPETIKKRKNALLRLSEQVAFELREKYVGRTMTVLTERGGFGHTDNFLPVSLENFPNREANLLVEVKIIENNPKALVGKVVSKL